MASKKNEDRLNAVKECISASLRMLEKELLQKAASIAATIDQQAAIRTGNGLDGDFTLTLSTSLLFKVNDSDKSLADASATCKWGCKDSVSTGSAKINPKQPGLPMSDSVPPTEASGGKDGKPPAKPATKKPAGKKASAKPPAK